MDTSGINVATPSIATVKPVLKHPPNTSMSSSLDRGHGATRTKSTSQKHLKWDEHAIGEHDLLRGTRMKIDEPNTPYTNYEHHSEDEESTSSGRHPRSPDEKCSSNGTALAWNALETKLQAVVDKREMDTISPAPSRDSNMSDNECSEQAKNILRKKQENHEKEFKDHRKKHYNEGEALKRWRREHPTDDEEEEDNMQE